MSRRMVVTPEITEWRGENPLRLWLDVESGRFQDLLVKLSITKSGIFAWLHGVALPKPERMLELERISGIEPRDWLTWWVSRPGEGKVLPQGATATKPSVTRKAQKRRGR